MGRQLRLLVIDDSADDTELLIRLLRGSGYHPIHQLVETASALQQALKEQPWDVVISDFQMPELNGFEALRLVREHSPELPFLAVSGTIGDEQAVEMLRAGANDYLLKDRTARLGSAIERALAEASERQTRRLAERALRESEERFRTLVDSMDDIVLSLDRDLRIDGLYGRWPSHDAVSSRGLIGQSLREVFGEQDARLHEEAARLALDGQRTPYESSFDTGAGGVRSFHIRLSARRSDRGEVTGLVGVGRDITAQKEVQAQLATADRMASIGLIAAGVAHEVNTPLAAVLANTELSLLDVQDGELDADRHEQLVQQLTDVQDSAQRIARIVRDLGLFSRAPVDQLELVDVRQVLDAALRLTEGQVRYRARLVRADGDVPLVLANGSRLGQVFLNLILNAVQAIPEGCREANQVRIVTRQQGDDRVVIEVHDTGAGMGPEVVAQLFTPFFTTKAPGVGTGLGLSICHRLLQAMGGTIAVESQPGAGTTFRVSLPTSPAVEARPQVSPRPGSQARWRVSSPPRVLVLDHSPNTRVLLQRMLSDASRPAGASREPEPLTPDQLDPMIVMFGGVVVGELKGFLSDVPGQYLERPLDPDRLREEVTRQLQRRLADRGRGH